MSNLRIQLPVLNSTPQGGGARVREVGGGEPPTAPAPARMPNAECLTPSPLPHEPNLVLDGEGGLELFPGKPNSGAIVGNTSSPDHSSLAAGHALFSFAPSPVAQSQLLEALSDPTFSLLSLARTYNISLDALIVWMDRPDIQERINAIDNASIRRNRLVANTRMTRVIQTCEDILNGYSDEELNNPIRRTDTLAIEQRRRSRLIALKAANLIARISRWSSPPQPARPRVARLSEPGRCPPHEGEVPSLRGGGGRTPESQQAAPDALDAYMLTAAQRADPVSARRISEEALPAAPAQLPPQHDSVPRTEDSGRSSAGAEQRPQFRRGGTKDCLSLPAPRTEDCLSLPSLPLHSPSHSSPSQAAPPEPHASHASHPSHPPNPDSS